MLEAMLRASGELGYQRVTVDAVVERAGTTTAQFEASFSDLSDCFQQAYEAEAWRLCEAILEAGRSASSWRAGLRAALRVLAVYARERSPQLRALLFDVQVAGGATFACRSEVVERLSHALDSARRENRSRHSPPPLTALFMVSVVEAAAASALIRGEEESMLEVIPELEQLIVRAYFAE